MGNVSTPRVTQTPYQTTPFQVCSALAGKRIVVVSGSHVINGTWKPPDQSCRAMGDDALALVERNATSTQTVHETQLALVTSPMAKKNPVRKPKASKISQMQRDIRKASNVLSDRTGDFSRLDGLVCDYILQNNEARAAQGKEFVAAYYLQFDDDAS